MEENGFRKVYTEAVAAGERAGRDAIPTPMVVYEASLFSDEKLPGGREWRVPEGPCGFGWIEFPDARVPIVRWMKKNGIGRKGYPKGWSIWVHEFNQSYERKVAYARAFADVMRSHGFTCYGTGRLD